MVSADGSDDYGAFGSRLRVSRLVAGLSQEELAERSGISVRSISDLERGRTRWPHPDSVQRLADALELDDARREEFVALAARRLGPHATPAGVSASAGHLALARTGQQAGAVEVYEGLRRLDEEPGARLGPELTPAHQRVLRQGIPPAAAGNTAAANGPGTRAGPRLAPEVRYSLPPHTSAFTGRQAELDRITAAVTEAVGTGGAVAIHAIGGMPGVGKTALAVHAAHVLKDRFPDRQLFLSLHGHALGQDPVTSEAALAGLLAAVGVDPRYLPAGLEARTALWRDRMAGQKALLVLDNAASSAQVTPLLPGSGGCLVLVTSRRHLGDLPGAAAPVLLEALSPQEAREMFIQLAPRAADGPPETVAELAELAGFLPLAVSLLARVCAWHPSWTLADLAAETRTRMLNLAAENDSVAAAFGVSYRHLDPGLQEFFRYLALHPGTTIDGYAAAALADCSLDEADRELDALQGEGLLTEAGHRRYGMHDLIRRYAQDLAAADPADSREQALEWLLDYYQHTAARAGTILGRQARATSPARSPQTPAVAVPGLAGSAQALAWARAEHSSLLACLDHATAAGRHARVVTFTAAIASLLRHDGPWESAITRHTTAVAAARHLGDRLGHANALIDLGDLRRRIGHYRGAAEALEEALAICREAGHRLGEADALTFLGDLRRMTGDYRGSAEALDDALTICGDAGSRLGEASALTFLGVVRRMTGDYRGSAEALEEALGISRDIGSRLGQLGALGSLGVVRRMTGDYRGSAKSLEEALGISRDIGDRGGEAETLVEIGTLHQVRGDRDYAVGYFRQALHLAREITSPGDEAPALAGLGRCALAGGRTADAIAALRQARDIFRRIGAAEAADVAAELSGVRDRTGTWF